MRIRGQRRHLAAALIVASAAITAGPAVAAPKYCGWILDEPGDARTSAGQVDDSRDVIGAEVGERRERLRFVVQVSELALPGPTDLEAYAVNVAFHINETQFVGVAVAEPDGTQYGEVYVARGSGLGGERTRIPVTFDVNNDVVALEVRLADLRKHEKFGRGTPLYDPRVETLRRLRPKYPVANTPIFDSDTEVDTASSKKRPYEIGQGSCA